MIDETPQVETPKPKKEKKRYENEQQIIDDIDTTRIAINFLSEEADIFDCFASVMRLHPKFLSIGCKNRKSGSKWVFSQAQYQDKADKNRKRASNLENKRLKKLADALSTMRPGTLPEIVEDETIERPF